MRQEKQQHCLGEMPENANHSEGHTSKITESVAHEDLRGELIVLDQPQCNHDEGNDDGQREDMLTHNLRGGAQMDFLIYTC